MAGHKKFRDLVNRTMTPDSQARAHARALELRREMPLVELRQAREITQATLAELLETSQSEISRMEKRADMYVSTLRSYIEALGGTLSIVAYLPGGDAVEISQFREIGEATPERRRAVAPR